MRTSHEKALSRPVGISTCFRFSPTTQKGPEHHLRNEHIPMLNCHSKTSTNISIFQVLVARRPAFSPSPTKFSYTFTHLKSSSVTNLTMANGGSGLRNADVGILLHGLRLAFLRNRRLVGRAKGKNWGGSQQEGRDGSHSHQCSARCSLLPLLEGAAHRGYGLHIGCLDESLGKSSGLESVNRGKLSSVHSESHGEVAATEVLS